MQVVTISASYGAGGGLVGPAVARRLGVPFVDRAIPVAVANDLGIPVDDAVSRDERVSGWLSRLLLATAPLATDYMADPVHDRTAVLHDADVRRCTEGAIRRAVAAGGAVILGRAAAMVLREHPGAFHVRLDGAADRRVAQAVAQAGISEQDARDGMLRNDRARRDYVRHFYGADPADPHHYHLVLDSTQVPLDACAELIVAAVRACGDRPC